MGDKVEPRFGKLGKEYKQIVFDKTLLEKDATSEWVTPGHPLFETVRMSLSEQVRDDLLHGAVFFDLQASVPYHLDAYSASVKDGMGKELHRRIFVLQSLATGQMAVRQPTLFLDLVAAPSDTKAPTEITIPDSTQRENSLVEQCLAGFVKEVATARSKETEITRRHVRISLDELIHRQNLVYAGLNEQQQKLSGTPSWLTASMKQCEDRLDELNSRRERRMAELERESQCAIGDIQHIGSAWVLPHPERATEALRSMVRDEEIERIAVQAAIDYEKSQGRIAESVEAQNRGFDLISRKPHPEDPATAIDVRFIEVKGRATSGEIALTTNEYKTAERLKHEYWLYAVYNCSTKPELHAVRNPARMGWKPVVKVEHYTVDQSSIRAAEKE